MANSVLGVVLLGSDFKALAVARSLGRLGVPIGLVDNIPRSAWFSRHATKRFRWNQPMTGAAFAEFLLELADWQSMRGWILWPTQDETVEFVSRSWGRLSGAYRLITQPWETLMWAVDKRRLHAAANAAEILYPRTWYPDSEAELVRLELDYPVIVKPATSIDLQHAVGRKALQAGDRVELLDSYRTAARVIPADQITVQEVVPAQAQVSVAGFADQGRLLSAMTARRTRQYPVDYGLGSSFVEAVELPGLIGVASRLVARLELSGMTEVEFVVDSRDLQPRLLDVNPRPWGWHSLCIACGLDYPRIQYEHAMGRPAPDLAPRYGPRWIRLMTDVPAGIQGMRRGLYSPSSYLGSLLSWRLVGSVLDWRDPMPAAGDALVAASRVLRARRFSASPSAPAAAKQPQDPLPPRPAVHAAGASSRPPPESG